MVLFSLSRCEGWEEKEVGEEKESSAKVGALSKFSHIEESHFNNTMLELSLL